MILKKQIHISFFFNTNVQISKAYISLELLFSFKDINLGSLVVDLNLIDDINKKIVEKNPGAYYLAALFFMPYSVQNLSLRTHQCFDSVDAEASRCALADMVREQDVQ